MNQQPLVSVIMIFLNEEKFLAEAIESVLAQTYGDWELLLVDDGSTDRSTEIAQQYAAQYPQLRYLEHPEHQNRGMSAARNLGLSLAKGKYISPLDGDDVWLPQKLSQQVAILEAYPEAAMVFAPLLIWYSWTGNPEDLDRDHPYGVAKDGGCHPLSDTLVPPPKMLSFFLRREEFIPGGVLARREIIQQLGGGDDSFRGSYEDAIVHVKICLKHPVYVSNECWYKYRIHPDSCQRVVIKSGQAEAKRLRYLNWVAQYLQEQGVREPEVWQSLRHALFPFQHPQLHQLQTSYQQAIAKTKIAVKQGAKLLLPEQIRCWLKAVWREHLKFDSRYH